VSYSLNEVSSLVVKAIRGSGLDWGVAEEAGFAVRWLCRIELPGAAILAQRLLLHEKIAAKMACPLAVGMRVSDRAHEFHRELGSMLPAVVCPLLLMPFIANVAKQRSSLIRIRWGAQELFVDESNLWLLLDKGIQRLSVSDLLSELDPCEVADIELMLVSSSVDNKLKRPEVVRTEHCRVDLDSDTLNCLNEFAARTYA